MQHLRASLKQALRARPYIFDTAVAVCVYAVILTAASAGRPRPELTPGLAVAGVVVCGALTFRRRWPLGVLAATGSTASTTGAGHGPLPGCPASAAAALDRQRV